MPASKCKQRFLKLIKYSLRFLPDRIYIRLYFMLRVRKLLHLNNPVTYNEKLQWLKLHDRNPTYPHLVDKAEAKSRAAAKIGNEHVIPTFGVWDKFEDIDLDSLPKQFVLKCTHDSEGVVIVTDKSNMNWAEIERKLNKALSFNFYYIGREWPYKEIRPRIIAEKYLQDSETQELRDYKFFCFSGEPICLFVASGRATGETAFDFFDLDFNLLSVQQGYPNSGKRIRKPATFAQMIDCSRILSEGMPHVRIDFYEVNGQLYFGEFTFYHFSGFVPFLPADWDRQFGNWLQLPSLDGGVDH